MAPKRTAPAAAAAGGGGPLLCDLGELVFGTVLKRPSASVKTPYVADVLLESGQQVLAHTPALDCAGLIVPGCRVGMTANAPRKAGAPPTRTTHSIQLAEEPREDGAAAAAVGAHPSLAEAFAAAALERRLVPELGRYTRVLRQQTVGGVRVDFVLEGEDGGVTLVEVKNVVCADYPEGRVPEGRSKVGVYTSAAQPYARTALFPHGAQKKPIGVVSDRAIKHIHELTGIHRAATLELPPRLAATLGRAAENDGGEDGGAAKVEAKARAAVLFVVNRGDCAAFRPCHEACPLLARMLRRAEEAGVAVLAYAIDWQGGRASWGRRLPVVYGEGVQAADVDEEHLAQVLEFNATDPRTHYKKGAAAAAAKTSKAYAKGAKTAAKAAPKAAAKAAAKSAAGDEKVEPGPGAAEAGAAAGRAGEGGSRGAGRKGQADAPTPPLVRSSRGPRAKRAAALEAAAAPGPSNGTASRDKAPAAADATTEAAAAPAETRRVVKRRAATALAAAAAAAEGGGDGGEGDGSGPARPAKRAARASVAATRSAGDAGGAPAARAERASRCKAG